MNIIAILLLVITVISNIALGSLIIKSSKKEYSWLFLLVNISVSFWAIGDLVMLFSTNKDIAFLGAMIFYIAPIFTPVALMLFSQGFPNGVKNKTLYVISFVSVLLVSLAIAITSETFISSITINETGQNVIIPNKQYFFAYSLFLSIFFILTYVNFYRRIRITTGVVRSQLSYAFFGVFVSSNIAMFTNVLMPSRGIYNLVWVGPPATMIAVTIIALAIIRYKLFEVKSTIARALGYSSFIIIITLIYVLTVSLISTFIFRRESINNADLAINALAALVVAFTFGPLRSKFDKYTNSIFFRDAYDPQVVLNELNASLVSSSHIEELLSQANNTLSKHIKPVFNGIIVDSEERDFKNIFSSENFKLSEDVIEQIATNIIDLPSKTFVLEQMGPDQKAVKKLMQSNQIALVTKLITKNELVGLIVLGDRKSGNNYSQKDIQLIETAGDSISIAAQNALRYEEIKKFNVTLEHKIETATHQLQKSNEKLKALDEAKDEFISMASHQLRTPLTSVKGYVSMVLEEDAGPINDQQRKFLNQAFISSQRMVYLISDLLNVSRLKTGKFVIENKPAYLPDTVEQEIAQLEETVKARELTMKYSKPESFPTVGIDEEKLRQVIMNFADNAIYYTPAGGIIRIELKATKDSIEYTVKDDGIGVPKSEQPHLFTKFYRAGNARKARPDGTGLGLFMAKKVITAQGGAIIFHSAEGKGSTFGFTLPRKKVEITNK
jgi:signal transduction histidine kinase